MDVLQIYLRFFKFDLTLIFTSSYCHTIIIIKEIRRKQIKREDLK